MPARARSSSLPCSSLWSTSVVFFSRCRPALRGRQSAVASRALRANATERGRAPAGADGRRGDAARSGPGGRAQRAPLAVGAAVESTKWYACYLLDPEGGREGCADAANLRPDADGERARARVERRRHALRGDGTLRRRLGAFQTALATAASCASDGARGARRRVRRAQTSRGCLRMNHDGVEWSSSCADADEGEETPRPTARMLEWSAECLFAEVLREVRAAMLGHPRHDGGGTPAVPRGARASRHGRRRRGRAPLFLRRRRAWRPRAPTRRPDFATPVDNDGARGRCARRRRPRRRGRRGCGGRRRRAVVGRTSVRRRKRMSISFVGARRANARCTACNCARSRPERAPSPTAHRRTTTARGRRAHLPPPRRHRRS